jgi:chemotaxis protein methyltransferase CheR
MVGESQPIAIEVVADEGMIESSMAVSLGLIVTELLINAIKYAFPVVKAGAHVRITYEVAGPDWRLIVSDNGVGASADAVGRKGGLGTAIVTALAKQLGARLEIGGGADGMQVSITQASFAAPMPQAA